MRPDDRSILTLAIPALGALAADPLYSLVDTALVGHLGAIELGALAVGTAAFTASFWLFSFLAYGVTPRVARALGRADTAAASRIGIQALLLAGALGAAVSLGGLLFAGPVVRLLGAEGEVAALAEPYLRIRVLSAVPVLVATVGHGWLRGDRDTRTPMYIAGAGAAANVVLDYLLIYPVGLGVRGAAWATVVGQSGAAAVFVFVLLRRMEAPRWELHAPTMRSLLSVGADLTVRTGALLAGLTGATAVAARMGVIALGSWQIAMQMFAFLALTLDSIAISGQALVAGHLGAGAADRAREVGRRLMVWGVGLGTLLLIVLLVAREPVARVFTGDAALVAATAPLLGWLAVVQPLAAAAFTLDGILIGANDTRFLAVSMVFASAAFVGLSVLSLQAGWGTAGLAGSATVWLGARSIALGVRLRSGRWVTA